MKRIILFLILTINLFLSAISASAQERRPIDNRHPMWMIHIDVWNNADPQKIIDLIPKDIKPYVCLNLSMSCSYDDDLGIFKKPQDALQTFRSWASVCCRNNMWFTCQPASGGRGHMPDDAAHIQATLNTMESFFKDYKNFLGWNYAEQFWGFDENSKSSSKAVDRMKLFAKLVPMHHKYGGFLTISFCGNVWSHPINPMGMMKRNTDYFKACKNYPEAILYLYKYTTSANWFNNESITIGPFISGLCKNYGVRYDNCGWNGAIDEFCKNDGKKHTYPGAVGIAPVLEQMTLNGACVWDGPELIWTEDFKGINNTQANGYTRRNWGTYANFDNIWVDMFRKVLDGTIHIASREEVVARTKIVIKNDITESGDNTGLKVNAFAAPIDLYHGLYLQENDPFNARESYEGAVGKSLKGYGNNNFLYFKKTGRYQTIPVVIDLYDSLAKTIPATGVIKRSLFNTQTKWKTQKTKVAEFDKVYPEVSKGDLFVARHHNQLTCYYPYSYLNKRKTASGDVPLLYNSCDSIKMKFALFSNALVHEYADHIDFYFNNYREDTTAVKSDIITIIGAKEKPSYTYKKRAKANGSLSENWDEETGTYTLTLKHNGPFDVTINCAGDNEKELLTDYVDVTPLVETEIEQPEDYYGDLIIEAEDMDYKNLECVVDQYNSSYRSMRGHSGMGFVRTKTSSEASLKNETKINFAGTYKVIIKYSSTAAASIRASFGKSGTKSLKVEACKTNEWKTVEFEGTATAGKNNFVFTNTGGKDMYIDNVTFSPIELDILTSVDDAISERTSFEKEYYSLSGTKLNGPQRGINIIRMKDGTTKKIFVK